jgi:hypothetical protein
VNVQTQLRILAALDAKGGVLMPATALPLGISRQLLTEALNIGIVERPKRGVYVRPGLVAADLRAASARLGPPSALSHRGAASYYGLDGVEPGTLEWSIPHTRRAPMEGVHLRRRFGDLQIEEREGLVVTSVLQTLADLGSVVHPDRVERALESAIRLKLTTDAELRSFAAPRSHRPGAPALRFVLRRRPVDAPATESDAETLCLQVYRRGGVPEPGRQHELFDDFGIFVARIDLHWWPIPFGVEIDGLESHSTREALQYDLTRGNNVGNRGHLIRRFTYADVTRRSAYVCRTTLRGLAIAETQLTNRSRKRRKGD